MSRLDEAFIAAADIHESDEIDDGPYNFLRLECLGPAGSKMPWAAMFDCSQGDDEWFEDRSINDYPTAFRANTPEDAIFGAVEKFNKLTSRIAKQRDV
ncbi:MAG TPA: hypothetical protein VL866_24520 [Pyrinomonadaceae bacterium]|nr:hypothetical protein [Pyrinomonadaceae bacterium]